MVEKFLVTVFCTIAGYTSAIAQSDSTDLELSMIEMTLESALDSMLYDPELFENLQFEFTISDTVNFEKARVELTNKSTGELLFKNNYSLSDLLENSLIESWNVSLGLGNLRRDESYKVSLIIEDYTGALGATIHKTIHP
jgi:hypothetical protein